MRSFFCFLIKLILQHLVKMLGNLWMISVLVIVVKSQFPKILWTYWDGDQNQTTIRLFIENHERFLKDKWQVRVLDINSAKKYAEKIPYYQGDLDSKDFFTSQQQKSDYLRILLISYYGGVYVDMSSILIEDFSWLQFQNLRNDPNVLNKHGSQPEVLLFVYNFYGSQETYFDKSLNQTFEISPGYEVWFIAAVPNSTLLMQYFPMFREGLINKVVTQQGEHKFFDKIVEQQKIDVGILKHSGYLNTLQQLQIIIQRKQHQFDKLTNQNNSSRQLAVWHYKIWHIHCYYGPFIIVYYSGPYIQAFFLAKYSLPILKNVMKRNSIRYFIKFTGGCRKILQQFFTTSRLKDLLELINPKKYNIYEGSIIHKYLIENSTFQHQFKLSSIIKEEFDMDYAHPEIYLLLKIVIVVALCMAIVFTSMGIIIYRRFIRHLKIGARVETNQSIAEQSSKQNIS